MDYELIQNAEKYSRKNRRKRIWQKFASVLGCAVVFCTTYALIIPAITMEKETICGMEEHTHTDACYTLDAGLEPVCSEDSLGIHRHSGCSEDSCGYADYVVHTHNSSCYDDVGNFWCPLPEIEEHYHSDSCYEVTIIPADVHFHDDSCYMDVMGELICDEPLEIPHEHDDSCYLSSTELTCEIPESEGHGHTETCLDEEGNVICGLEEQEGHQHGEECYTTVTELNCDRTVEVVHSHGDSCYAWSRERICGQEESDPSEAVDQEIWELVCGKEEIILHEHSGACESGCGLPELHAHYHSDACFRAYDNGMVLSCGMEEHVHTEECKPSMEMIFTSGEETTESTEETTDATQSIVETTEETMDATESTVETTLETTDATESTVEATEETTEATEETIAPTVAATEPSEVVLSSEIVSVEEMEVLLGGLLREAEEVPLSNTTISGLGTKYDPVADVFNTQLDVQFTLTGDEIGVDKTYVYNYPQGVVIPEGLLNTSGPLPDMSGEDAGTYTFVKNEDGTYSVKIQLDPEYVEGAGNTISGHVWFKGSFSGDSTNEDGDLVVGGDDAIIITPSEEIEYPDGETNEYNIRTTKSVINYGDTLTYTVLVKSEKGTPDPIILEDTISANNAVLGQPTITIEKGQYEYYTGWEQVVADSFQTANANSIAFNNNTLTVNLPGLAEGEAYNNGILANCYRITYTYDISNLPAGDYSVGNGVTVSATDEDTNQTVTDSDETTTPINNSLTLYKTEANLDAGKGQITWKLQLNTNQANITGAVLTDTMFGNLADGENTLKIEPANGYTVNKDDQGKVTGITFQEVDGNANRQTYTITYTTNVDPSWDDQKLTNIAKLDPDPNTPDDEQTASKEIWVSGGGVAKVKGEVTASGDTATIPWTVTITSPVGGIPAGTEIKDTLSGYQHYTKEQIAAWGGALTWDNNSPADQSDFVITFVGSDGKTYTLAEVASSENVTFTQMTIVPNKDIPCPEGASKLSFTINSTADLTKADTGVLTYTNTVEVGNDKAEDKYEYDKGDYGVDKKAQEQYILSEDGKTATINWDVKVTIPKAGIAAETEIVDTILSNGHYMTKEQAAAWNPDLKWGNGTSIYEGDYSISFIGSDNVIYTKNTLNSIPEGVTIKGITVKTTKAMARPDENTDHFCFTIPTTADLTIGGEGILTYQNKVSVGDKEDTDSFEYDKGSVDVEKKLGTATLNEDKTQAVLDWTISVSVPEGGLKSGTVIEDEMSGIDSNWQGVSHWITLEQLKAWTPVLVWDDASNTPLDTSAYKVSVRNGNWAFIDLSAVKDGSDTTVDKTTYFTITLTQDIARPQGATKLIFQVPTTADLTGGGFGVNTYSNKAKVNGKESTDEYTYDKGDITLTKVLTNENPVITDNKAELTWKVDIGVPAAGIPKNFVISDTLSGNGHYLTQAQVAAWNGVFTWENSTPLESDKYSVMIIGENNQEYPLADVIANADNRFADMKFYGVKLTAAAQIMPPEGVTTLSFTMNSTADLTAAYIGENTYTNKVTAGNKSAEDSYTSFKGGVQKLDGQGRPGTTQTSSDGSIEWKVRVTTDAQDSRWIKVTDTLPAGVKLESITINDGVNMSLAIAEDGTIQKTESGYMVIGSYNAETNVVELTLSRENETDVIPAKSIYTFTYKCSADPEKLENYVSGTMYQLTNKVTVETDKTMLGDDEQTQEWTYQETVTESQVVDKSGEWNNAKRTMDYVVYLNPDAKDIVPDSDVLSLTDTLGYYKLIDVYTAIQYDPDFKQHQHEIEVSLIQNSVKLYYAEGYAEGNKREYTDWDWKMTKKAADWSQNGNYMNNIIEASNIPDGTALVLEYSYQVASDICDNDKVSLKFENTATLNGTSHSDKETEDNVEWKEQTSGGGITTDKKSFTLYKVEKDKHNKVLPGAEFSVYAYDAQAGDYSTTVISTHVTDDEGKITIIWDEQKYQANVLYKVVETKAPQGYLIPDPAPTYYFYFSDKDVETSSMPDTIPGSAVDLSAKEHFVYAENIRNYTDIGVEKQWDGTPADSIEVKLYRIESDTPTTGGGGISGSGGNTVSLTITDNNSGAGTFQDFTATYPKGTTVTYKVTYKWANYNSPNCTVSANGQVIETSVTTGEVANGSQDQHHTFSVTLDENTTVVLNLGDNQRNNWSGTLISAEEPETGSDSGETPQDTLVETVNISASDGWHHVFERLPLSEVKDDNTTVYYSYYVVETPIPNCNTSYENNSGITEGTIVIRNEMVEIPEYRLPETGGSGTELYTAGGFAMIIAAGILLLCNQIKCRKEDIASS